MAVHLKCAHCQRRLAVSRRHAGSEIPCPICGLAVAVPAEETAITLRAKPAAAPQAVEEPVAEAVVPAVEEKSTPSPLINKRAVVASATAAAVVLAGVAIAGLALSRSRAVQETPVVLTPSPVVAVSAEEAEEESSPLEEPEFLPSAARPPAVAAAPEPEMAHQPPAPLMVQRRDKLSDEELRKQLQGAPELNIYNEKFLPKNDSYNPRRVVSEDAYQRGLQGMKLHESVAMIEKRPDLTGLPLLKGPDCQLGKEPAEDLQAFSRKARDAMAKAQDPRDPDAAAEAIRAAFQIAHGSSVFRPNGRSRIFERTIPTLMQMLIPENQAVREVLVDHLASVKGPAASKALAKIAIFDLSEKVRQDALEALRDRPHDDYRQVLLDGLRYVWPPVADHAAEALVVLRDVDAVSRLRELAVAPDPRAPFFDATNNTYARRELVQINHLKNCMMCHAPSKGTNDLVRGRVPMPGAPLPPLSQYYESTEGIFVRADITYLRQDFSVPQPVDNHGRWPTMRRFDYLVRNVPLPPDTDIEKERLRYGRDYPQRDAVLYALKALSDRERP
jgi:hypothetical protein